jgi:uncharacterized protein (DUF924 family)
MNDTVEEILSWWFGDMDGPHDMDMSKLPMWFMGGPDFDREVRERWGEPVERAMRGELDEWAETPRGRLALVLLLDQLTRNVFRGSARSFEADPKALALVLEGIERGHDTELRTVERQFLYMPLMHAEDRDVAERSVAIARALRDALPEDVRPRFQGYVDHAEKHAAIVRQFGRYPHRNEVLGRESSEEELAFMKEKGRGF